jgi:DNA-binding CsgD family transcriptional regulator
VIGLWLAEGDSKSKHEITITNNCFELIIQSYNILRKLFKSNNFRLYIYSPNSGLVPVKKIPNIRIREYVDKRASKPYYIIRIANVAFVKKWKGYVSKAIKTEKFYGDILRGFFAGEGNVKEGTHSNRTLRIAQKNQIEIVDKILEKYKIEYTFRPSERAYVIFGRLNWEKMAKIKVADLHPDKKRKFWKIFKSYKEWHYKKNYIRDSLLYQLDEPKTSLQISKYYKRKHCRITEVLCYLKKENKVRFFKVGSTCFWVKSNAKLIVISKRKKSILELLQTPKRNYEIARILKIDPKSTLNRLNEMRKLRLVDRRNDYNWYLIPNDKEVKVLE